MKPTTQNGYLVLADISGFTSYLAKVELDHAHEILTELLETIVGRLKSVLTISKLEGDAVFAYAADGQVARGETLLELIESTYTAFRDRVEAVLRRTTCACNACRTIPALDLKFLVHHGDYIVQQVSGIRELVGSDVNLVHRLLKNHVAEATGWRAYALFTEKVLERMGVRPEGLHQQPESYEHLGQVTTYALDLHPRYQALTDARRVFITAAEADVVLTFDTPAAPPVVWEWLNDPVRRNRWGGDVQWSAGLRPAGRTGVGARNHCAHGKGTSVETVEDWRPFDYVTTRSEDSGAPAGSYLRETDQLEPLPDGGTRLHAHIQLCGVKLPRVITRLLCRFMMLHVYHYDRLLQGMIQLTMEDSSGQRQTEESPVGTAA